MKLRAVREQNSRKKVYVLVIHEIGVERPCILDIVSTREEAEKIKDSWNLKNETENIWCDFFSDIPEEINFYL